MIRGKNKTHTVVMISTKNKWAHTELYGHHDYACDCHTNRKSSIERGRLRECFTPLDNFCLSCF
jgi:arginine utilization protein RocB